MATFKVGDVVTTYHKGYWRITKIERRFLTKDDLRYTCYKNKKVGDEYSSLIHYESICDLEGKRRKKKTNSCDALYVRLMTKELIEMSVRLKIDQYNMISQHLGFGPLPPKYLTAHL